MRTQTTDDQDTLRFRAPSLEEAVKLAEESLGTRVRVVAANRIRRGGIGGFFASDLGVEVIVSPEAETVEDALERLINDSAAEDRSSWSADRGVGGRAAAESTDGDTLDMPGRRWLLDQAGNLPPATAAAIADALAEVNERTSQPPRRREVELIDPSDPTTNTSSWWEPPAADRRRELEQTLAAEFAPRAVDVVDLLTALAGSDRPEHRVDADVASLRLDNIPTSALPTITPEMLAPVPVTDSPSLVRVEKIIEELQALTASPRLLTAMKDRQRAEALATTMAPTVLDTAAPVVDTPSSVAPVAASTSVLGTPRGLVQTGAVAMTTSTESDPTVVTSAESTSGRVAAVTAAMATDRLAGPSQQQVELAVAAADQLLESLSRDEGVRRVSVRIVLRTADNDEVQAEADWEANA